jgi:hypothetical protein
MSILVLRMERMKRIYKYGSLRYNISTISPGVNTFQYDIDTENVDEVWCSGIFYHIFILNFIHINVKWR